MTERKEITNPLPIVEGPSGAFYVLIGQTPQGADAIDIARFASRDELFRVIIPKDTRTTMADRSKVLTRFGETYKRIVKEYSPQEKPSV